MKIAMIQQNYIIGDFENNIDKILLSCQENMSADMIVFSELSLSGYYPWDLVYRPTFLERQENSLQKLCQFSKTIKSYIVVGMVRTNDTNIGKPFFNSLIVIKDGEICFNYDKKLLPTYNIFDEKRHFEEGITSGIFNIKINNSLKKIGFFICEDGWNDEANDYTVNPIKEIAIDNPDIIIGINASPSNLNKQEQRDSIFSKISKKYQTALIYVNQVGGHDDIVFDGSSFVFDKNGKKIIQLKSFQEDSIIYDSEILYDIVSNNNSNKNEFIFNQISLGLKDYLSKQGIKNVVIGSSGGIDSALTLAIATLTLGPENVVGITMPSKYSSLGSISDSHDLCSNLGIKLYEYPIHDEVEVFNNKFKISIGDPLIGIAAENLQARIRGTILMAYSNQNGHLLLTTGNKSEISVGYFTLYGDSNGGLNLIGDLYKTEVFELCKWINEKFGILIPINIIDKPPSAELAPDQKDTDSLPEYKYLDAILKQEFEWDFFSEEERIEISTLIKAVEPTLYSKVLKLIDRSEFKRKQAALIIRVHPRAFGYGRQIPIVHK